MRIDHLELKNFRCFESLAVKFDPSMTVLVAPNGHGKSSILDAIKIAVWPYVAGFDLGAVIGATTGIQVDDVRRVELGSHRMEWRLPAEVVATGQIGARRLILDGAVTDPSPQSPGQGLDVVAAFSSEVQWAGRRFREKVSKSTKTKSSSPKSAVGLKPVAEAFQRRIFSEVGDCNDDLPMLGYYGTCRLCSEKKLTTKSKSTGTEIQSRTFAYRDCLDSSSSYKHFDAWFTRIHRAYFQAQIRNIEHGLPLSSDVPSALIGPFKAVQLAIDATLRPQTGWHRLEYSAEHEELVLSHELHGELKVRQLSDGIRSVLALVGDIAFRCYKLNPHLGQYAPLKTKGIVLVDEVDMHLHPAWQQTILLSLREAFPQIQFIVTTHSPQVLTSVDSSCIRALQEEPDPETGKSHLVVKSGFAQTKGVASSDLLAKIMGVSPIPQVPEAKMVSDYHALIQQDLHGSDEGEALRTLLINHFGEVHPVIRECDRMIRLQRFKQQLPIPAGHD